MLPQGCAAIGGAQGSSLLEERYDSVDEEVEAVAAGHGGRPQDESVHCAGADEGVQPGRERVR